MRQQSHTAVDKQASEWVIYRQCQIHLHIVPFTVRCCLSSRVLELSVVTLICHRCHAGDVAGLQQDRCTCRVSHREYRDAPICVHQSHRPSSCTARTRLRRLSLRLGAAECSCMSSCSSTSSSRDDMAAAVATVPGWFECAMRCRSFKWTRCGAAVSTFGGTQVPDCVCGFHWPGERCVYSGQCRNLAGCVAKQLVWCASWRPEALLSTADNPRV